VAVSVMHLALGRDAHILVEMPQKTSLGWIDGGCVGEYKREASVQCRSLVGSKAVDLVYPAGVPGERASHIVSSDHID
jgi:hypothetical protein